MMCDRLKKKEDVNWKISGEILDKKVGYSRRLVEEMYPKETLFRLTFKGQAEKK